MSNVQNRLRLCACDDCVRVAGPRERDIPRGEHVPGSLKWVPRGPFPAGLDRDIPAGQTVAADRVRARKVPHDGGC
jgi:hypothetical protein